MKKASRLKPLDERLTMMDETDPNYENSVAFEREREELVRDHGGQYVAYNDGKRLGIDKDEEHVYQEARKMVPRGIILVQEITLDYPPSVRGPRRLRVTD